MLFKKLSWPDFKKYFAILFLIFFGCIMIYSGAILVVEYFISAINYMGAWAFSLISPLIIGFVFVGFGVAKLLEIPKLNE